MDRAEPVLRVGDPRGRAGDRGADEGVGRWAVPAFYDERQSASAVRYVAQVDPMLLADGTYFVLESGGEMVACGGWSRRDRLYTGSGDADGDDRIAGPRAPSRPRSGRCSCGRLDAARARTADHRGVRGRGAARGLPAARARGDAARACRCTPLRVRAARGGRDRDAGRRQLAYVSMAKSLKGST